MKKYEGKSFLNARVTHLEMHARPHQFIAPPINARLAFMRAHKIPVHFYRYLYEFVGRQHHWSTRRHLDDMALSQIIHNDKTMIHIFYIDGCPAGFAEVSTNLMPEYVEIIYFGLIQDYQGRGLSRFFFNEVVSAAWDEDPQSLMIQTNTLDNPRALQIYQKAGFEPIGFSDVMIERWD